MKNLLYAACAALSSLNKKDYEVEGKTNKEVLHDLARDAVEIGYNVCKGGDVDHEDYENLSAFMSEDMEEQVHDLLNIVLDRLEGNR